MATRNSQTRAKFAYLKYESMLANLNDSTLDPKKKLNAFDINFTPDTKECYVIAPDLTPWAVKSKVYTFDSVESALEQLNKNIDTYPGQIVAIKYGEKYFGYIVNPASGGYSVTPLSEHLAPIDYNNLGNRPIINAVGEIGNPIIISDLSNGVYLVSGQYQISPEIPTIYSSASNNIFVVEKDDTGTYIKKISAKEIKKYSITDGTIKETSEVTDDFLKNNGYVTENYVDAKIAALEVVTRSEVEEYVQQVISETLESTIDAKINDKLAEYIKPVEQSDIDQLFVEKLNNTTKYC